MLITFKSKSAADVTMYEKDAKPILDLLGKDTRRGVIVAAEADNAIAVIEAEIARSEMQSSDEGEAQDARPNDDAHDGANRQKDVKASARFYPLLETLRAAKSSGNPVAWGI